MKTSRQQTLPLVLILVVMDDALVLLSYPSWYVKLARVLILVVMDDALVHSSEIDI